MSKVASSNSFFVTGSAVATAAALVLVGYYYNGSDTSKKNYEVRDIEDDGNNINSDDMITADEIVGIFDKLFLELQNAFAMLMQQVQQIQMAGQMIPEKQLKQLIRAELERALTIKQKQIIEEQYDMDMKCCEEATWEFIIQDQNSAVIKAVERFQKLWENATGEPVTGWKPGQTDHDRQMMDDMMMEPLSPEDLITAAEAYFNSLTDFMRSLVQQYKAAGKDLKNPMIAQELNMDFSMKANDVGEDALKSMNITMNQFESSVKAHSNNPNVGRALGMLQMKQQQDMMSIE